MNDFLGKWIWCDYKSRNENLVALFSHKFFISDIQKVIVNITAETRYVLLINGQEIGRGPIRSYPSVKYYDSYDISTVVSRGYNLLGVKVWDYGWSTYQSISQPAGLMFEVYNGENIVSVSGTETKATIDEGHIYNTVKRNVNLGFMEKHNAALYPEDWEINFSASDHWNNAVQVTPQWTELLKRPLPLFSTREIYARNLVTLCEVDNGCQQFSINTRKNFFPERVDADETIFSGFIGFVIYSPKVMKGTISFPCRTWNGIIGNFKIEGKLYKVDNLHRDIEVKLKKGNQLFLMQVSGKYDDLYCHIEFMFPEKLHVRENGQNFFTIGPTARIFSGFNGIDEVYGGLNEFDRMQSHEEKHINIFSCNHFDELSDIKYIDKEYIFENEYIYSLIKRQCITKVIPVTNEKRFIQYGNLQPFIIETPKWGEDTRFILDFGDIYIGTLEFSLNAPKGTVIDFYGYENMYHGDIDFTVGLNNAIRYICKEGVQEFRSMTRIGLRYLAVTIHKPEYPVEFYDIHMNYSTYPNSFAGEFRCSDHLLNQIWKMCLHTLECCTEDTVTDCPTYEQAYWIGDALISANINSWSFGDYELLRHCIVLAKSAVYNTQIMNALGPTDWNTVIPMWSMNWILSIDKYILYSGDESIVFEVYDSVKLLLDTFKGLIGEDGAFLINAWNMLDWAHLDIYNHGVVTGQQAILSQCYILGNGYAKIMGEEELAANYKEIARKLRDYINNVLWNQDRQAFLDGWSPEHSFSKSYSVQTHSLLLSYDAIYDDTKKEKAMNYLVSKPDDFVDVGSPFILFYLYDCLAKDNFQYVLSDIKKRWGEMMRYDSHTCWEVFPGFYEVNRTRSYCHSWSASPIYFLSQFGLGVTILENAFKEIEINLPESDLLWCEGRIPTPYGTITVYWSCENQKKNYSIELPANINIINKLNNEWDVHIKKY